MASGYERSSPPRYHRSSMDLYHVSTPGGSRSAIPRSSSALNRKWVHRSHGDLTGDADLQISYPQSSFYQDLYRKYPRAFQRRRESRELGRKLFNSQHHVRFEDDTDMDDDRSVMSLRSARSERPVTNWDKEVGLYLGHKSRSRVCMTSAEPSEAGSVYSVKQRLHTSSQTLNKLLNESPLRRRFAESERGSSHYDSGTENEQPGNYYKPDKSRIRNRTHQRKVLQRKIDNRQNGAFDNFEHVDTWTGRQSAPITHQIVSPRKHKRYLPKVPQPKNRQVDVNALISNTDLKIDTLLEKMSMNTANPDSPPDSAIDVDTPSIQSAVTTDRGSHSGCVNLNCDSSPSNSSGKGVSELSSGNDSGLVNSSDGRHSRPHTHDQTGLLCPVDGTEMADPLKDKDNILLLQEYGMLSEDEELDKQFPSEEEIKPHFESNDTEIDSESKQIQEIVDNFTQSAANEEDRESDSRIAVPGQGLVQLFSPSSINIHKDLRNGIPQSSLNIHESTTTASDMAERISHDSTPTNEISNESLNNSNSNESNRSSVDDLEVKSPGDIVENKSCNVVEENVNYHADDEEDVHDDIVVAIETTQASTGQKRTYQRDSDVDSGIGQSSTGTRSPMSTLPPRGRAKQRGATTRTEPVRADHSLIHTRTDVDSCIEDEVNLVQLSHDLSHDLKRRGHHSNESDEKDDTNSQMRISKLTIKEQNIAARYRRHRSPSPFVVTNRRPQSAPSFCPTDTEMCFVNISLSNENVSETTSKHSNASKDELTCRKEDANSPPTQNGASDKTDKSKSIAGNHSAESQRDNNYSGVNEDKTLNSTFTIVSSSPVQQRKYSSSSYSLSSVSSSDTLKLSQLEIHKRSQEQGKDCVQDSDTLQYITTSSNEVNKISKIKSESATHIAMRGDNTNNFGEIKNKGATHTGHVRDQYRHSMSDMNTIEPVHVNSVTAGQLEVIADNSNMYDGWNTDGGQNNEYPVDNDIQGSRNSFASFQDAEPNVYKVANVNEAEHEVDHTDEYITEMRGIYKPSVTPPRVKAKRLKLKSMFKNKKGSFNPGAVPIITNDRNIVNRIYGRDNNDAGVRVPQAANMDVLDQESMFGNGQPVTELTDRAYLSSPVVLSCSEDSSDVSGSEMDTNESEITQKEVVHTVADVVIDGGVTRKKTSAIITSSQPINVKTVVHNGHNRDLHNGAQLNTVTTKPILINSRHIERNRHGDHVTDNHSNGVPVPPVRTNARNKNLPPDLNFSKYKIKNTEAPAAHTTNLNSHRGHSLDSVPNQSSGRAVSHDQPRLPKTATKGDHSIAVQQVSTAGPREHKRPDRRRVTEQPMKDIQVMPVEKSNLEKSKNISGSKLSLFDKMGGLKSATKGKFKAIRKAMSLERGIDQVGKSPHDERSGSGENKNSHSGFPRIKKAPSLKSITSLFGRKKKRGKLTLNDPGGTSGNIATHSNMKRQQWSSCDSLSNPRQPVGKLVKMNLDGSQVIELTKPDQGPLGFFIAKGSPQYKNGIFVSRFSNDGPEKMLAGLMGIGDEIMEINGNLVCDLSLDTVYKLMAAQQTLVLKLFPLIARIDV